MACLGWSQISAFMTVRCRGCGPGMALAESLESPGLSRRASGFARGRGCAHEGSAVAGRCCGVRSGGGGGVTDPGGCGSASCWGVSGAAGCCGVGVIVCGSRAGCCSGAGAGDWAGRSRGVADVGHVATAIPGATGNTLAWHAQDQRPTNTTTGLVQLGIRLYGSRTGQFLAPDPIPGGNTTTYTYPQDSINGADLDGQQCYSNPNYKRYCVPASKYGGKVFRKHAVFGASLCVGVCIGVSYQNRKWTRSLGAGALGGGITFGAAGRSAKKRSAYSGVFWAGPAYYSQGLRAGKKATVNRRDWEVGGTLGFGAGWGVIRNW